MPNLQEEAYKGRVELNACTDAVLEEIESLFCTFNAA